MRITQVKLRKACIRCHDETLAGFVQLVNGVHVAFCAVCEAPQRYNLSFADVYGEYGTRREKRFTVADSTWRRILMRDRTCVWDNAHAPGNVTADDFVRQVLVEELGPDAEDMLARIDGDTLRCGACRQFLPGLELTVPREVLTLLDPRSRAEILEYVKLVSWHPDHGVPISLARRAALTPDEEHWVTNRACMLSCHRCNRSRRDIFSDADRRAVLLKLRERLAADAAPWCDADERMYAAVCLKIGVAAKRVVA
jgi:hypothetical protein